MMLVSAILAAWFGSIAAEPTTQRANLRGGEVDTSVRKEDLQQCGVLGPGKGKSSESSTKRIVHGKDASQCVWRWQVGLGGSKSGPFCGGTLITPDWVLTAAHCVMDVRSTCQVRNLRIGAGKWERGENADESDSSVERRIKKIFTHPLYEENVVHDYDFALLKLDKPVPINDCIGTACLPSSVGEPGTDCRITGWGTIMSQGPTPDILQEAPVALLANKECELNYTESNDIITGSMLCASGRTDLGITDTCQGDSGGPLVCLEQGRYVLRGVTSWGQGCAFQGFPGVYGRVQSVLSWIEDVTHDKVVRSHAEDAEEQKDYPGVQFNGAMWQVASGDCTIDEEGCIQSPGFPEGYGNSEACEIAVDVPAAVPIRVMNFSTEQGFDRLVIDCEAFSGTSGPDGVIPTSALSWSTDESVTEGGWRLCPGAPNAAANSP